jgi:SAM-dependent methyltransferase
MKLRDSGMPDQAYWESLFDVPLILDRFDLGSECGDVAELGCGYGTFTVPIAKRIGGRMHAFDIEPQMVEATRERARVVGCTNVRVVLRDVFQSGFDLDAAACDVVLLFNILHGERPVEILREAARILRPDGKVAVIHWRTDIETPRGPTADIRPSGTQIAAWAAETGALRAGAGPFDLPPWHYGLELYHS